jgi:hypothetical protein
MEKIFLYKVFKNRFAKFFYLVGLLMFVYGVVFLARLFILDQQFDAFGSRTSLTFIVFQGLIVILQYAIALKNTRYFIEFGDNSISYLLPKQCSPESVNLQDINEIEVKLNEVVIHLPEGEKVLRFENVAYRELKQIKQRFEELKVAIDK